MEIRHDPLRQLNYLQQSFSHDKKPLGIFIGAGCPKAIPSSDDKGAEPLIPDIEGMTVAVREAVTAVSKLSDAFKTLEEHFVQDNREDPNVEDFLSHIRALRSVVGNDLVRGLTAEQLDNLDDEICSVIHDLVNKTLPSNTTAYHQIAGWIAGTLRDSPIEVFTPNYDLLMEQAFEDSRVPYFDGFAGARRPLFDLRAMEEDELPPRWARYWKIHGSINWYLHPTKGVYRGRATEEGAKRVIHPSHLKYDESRRMPYLAMMDRLRSFLKQPYSVIALCGYSFRDEHINETLIQGLQSNPTAMAFGLLYGSLDKYPTAISLVAVQSNLSLLARDGAIIGGQQGLWIESERETQPSKDSQWIEWVESDGEDSTLLRAELKLGDFGVFGDFFGQLIGQSLDHEDGPDAT